MPAAVARNASTNVTTPATPSKEKNPKSNTSTPTNAARSSARGKKRKAEEEEGEDTATPVRSSKRSKDFPQTSDVTNGIKEEPSPSPRAVRVKKEVKRSAKVVKEELEAEIEEAELEETQVDVAKGKPQDTPERSKKKRKTKKEKEAELQEREAEEQDTPKKPKRKRKTKEEREAEAMPLAARTTGLKMFVGAHVSMAKGIQNSVTNCLHIGGNAFALFLKSQRKWDNPPLEDENRDLFRKACTDNGYDATRYIVPHGSYLVNLAQEDPDKATQAYDAFLDDLHRCEALGIKLYNFHPGAASSSPLPEAITRLATQLNRAVSATSTVTPLLENMAGGGTVIGSRFSDLGAVISQITPEHRHRIGVCIDTCHAFAAGYDLRTPETFSAVLDDFDKAVGMRYLKALHINDSKAPLGAKRDLHQNLGLGFLGLRAFHNVMNEPRFEGLPLILETPIDRPDPADPTGKKTIEDKGVWAAEIKLLESLIGLDAEGPVFKKLEEELNAKGAVERKKYQNLYDAKLQKEREKMDKEKKKGQRSLLDMMTGEKTKTAKPKNKRKEEEGGRAGRKKKGNDSEESSLSSLPPLSSGEESEVD